MPISQEQLLKYFPHPEFRENQKETILQIIDHFDNGYKNVCLEMPTGGGKSAIAFTIARFMRDLPFIDPLSFDSVMPDSEHDLYSINGKSYIITPQKILQDQYGKDVENLFVNGRNAGFKGQK